MEAREALHHSVYLAIQDMLRAKDNFLITSHIHPDGDSITSMLVFAEILQYYKKKYKILLHDPVPKKFDFLSRVDEIYHYESIAQSWNPEVIVVLDSSNLDRIGNVVSLFPEGHPVINIDHHTSNKDFGDINLVNGLDSSTVEIVYDLVEAWDIPVTKEIATAVYTGILCDTGRFLFPNTTARSLSICSNMVKNGACPDEIAKKLYFRMSHVTARALAEALSTLEFHFDGAVACMHLANGMIPKNERIDTEGFVDHLLAIDNTEVEFLMVEKEPNLFRVSFRSKCYVDVNQVAQGFGGGGHARAAGCTISGNVKQIKGKIKEALKAHFASI